MKSIRRTLQGSLAVALGLLLATAGVALSLHLRGLFVTQFDAGLEASARLLAALVHLHQGNQVDTEFEEAWLPEYEAGPDAEYFELRGPDGARIEASASLKTSSIGDLPPGDARLRSWNLRLPDGRPGRALAFAFHPRIDEHRAQPESTVRISDMVLTLVAARGRASLDAGLGGVTAALVALGVALLIGVPLVVAAVVRRGLRPLDGLADRVKDIDARRLELGVALETMPDELRPIVGRLQDLLARLQASFERERRFSADVAHELRTPLAEMRTIAEVSLAEVDGGSEAGAALRDLRAATLQMERIVVTLLALARCQQGRQLVQPREVDLGQALAEAWAPLEEPARSKRLHLQLHLPGLQQVRTDPALLGSILGNLLSNAVAYTPEGGDIVATTGRVPGGVMLRLVNTQRDLEPRDLDPMFQPFWRKEQARSSGSHTGLGLALVAALARLMRIEIETALPRPDQFSVTLTIPGTL
jgi:signal transduction histidine kinase